MGIRLRIFVPYEDTALQMYWETVPKDSNSSIYQMKLFSDVTTSSTEGAGLEKYGPINSPSSNSLSYSVGLSGKQLGMSASWSTVDSDLSIANYTCTSCGMLELRFNFDRYSDYAHQSTVYEPAFSYNAWQGSSVSSIQMSNNRIARFFFYNGYGIGDDYTSSGNYLTSVPIYK